MQDSVTHRIKRINFISTVFIVWKFIYRVIQKSLWDFRPLQYSSRDDHAEGGDVNRVRDTLSFCPTLQVLDTSTLGDAADVNPVIKFLPHTCVARVWRTRTPRLNKICSNSTEIFINHMYNRNQHCNFSKAQPMSSLMMVHVNRNALE